MFSNWCESIAKNSLEYDLSSDKIKLTNQLKVDASTGLGIMVKCSVGVNGMPSDQRTETRLNGSSRNVGNNSASDAFRPTRRLVSDKVLLELRSRLKTVRRCSHGVEIGQSCSRDCKNNQARMSALRKYSDTSGYPANINSNSLRGSGSGTDFGVMSGPATDGSPVEKGSACCYSTKKSKSPPEKIILQMKERNSRLKSVHRKKVDPVQLQPDRPPYARRFMLAQRGNITPAPNPSLGEDRTPGFVVNSERREQPQFVLPPLPLGLRPPSPEPRSSLLNAPKKPRFPSPCSSSNTFDLSSLTQMLKPAEMANHEQKRPVCRELKFKD